MSRTVSLMGLALAALVTFVARDGAAQGRPSATQRAIDAAMRQCDTDAPRVCIRAIGRLSASVRARPEVKLRLLRAQFEQISPLLEPDGARALAAPARAELDRVYRSLVALTEQQPTLGEAWLVRGRIELSTNALDTSATSLDSATRLLPRDPAPANDLAMVLVALRRLPDAERALVRATGLAPNDAEPWSNLGAVRLGRGNAQAAADAFREAIRCAPTVARHPSDLGAALLAAGQPEPAARAFGDAVRLAPGDPLFRANLGYALSLANRLDDALAELRRATELGPRSSTAWNNLATVLSRRGDRAGAEAALRRALEVDPTDARARANLEALLSSSRATTPATRDAGR